jgi:hypothetical protein
MYPQNPLPCFSGNLESISQMHATNSIRTRGSTDGALFTGSQQEKYRSTTMPVYDFVVETVFSKRGIAERSIVVRHASDITVPRIERYASEGSNTKKRDIWIPQMCLL